MPNALLVDHAGRPDPDRVFPSLVSRNWHVTRYRFGTGCDDPDPADYDAIVLMGGHHSVRWIAADRERMREFRFVDRVLGEGRPLLGLGLGARVIAHAMGASVGPSRSGVEHGYIRVDPTPRGRAIMAESMMVFAFTDEAFGLPFGARRLAASRTLPNQAVCFGDKAYGFLFCPEIAPGRQESLMASLVLANDEFGPPHNFGVDIDRYDQKQSNWFTGFLETWLEDAIHGPEDAASRPNA